MKAKVSKGVGSEAWWSTPAPGWSEVGDAMYQYWHRYSRSTPRLEDEVALKALQFGYGARAAYGEHLLWADLEGPLEKDWRRADNGKHPWADVRNTVMEGWEGAANLEPILGESMVAEPLDVEPSVETAVPGGRPDR